MRKINTQQKLNIYLTSLALSTIQNDQQDFKPNESIGSFINFIIEHMMDTAKATISTAVSRYRDEVSTILFDSPVTAIRTIEPKKLETVSRMLVSRYEQSLIESQEDYSPTEHILIRLSNRNCAAIYGDDYQYREDDDVVWADEKYYLKTVQATGERSAFGALGRYLSAILEEYARKTVYQREEIIFAEELGIIRRAINDSKLLRLTMAFAADDLQTKTFDVRAFGVNEEKEAQFHYLICRSAPVYGTTSEKDQEKVASFRVSRISAIATRSSRSGALSAKERNAIRSQIDKVGVSFLLNPMDEIVVRFTEAGRRLYSTISHLRPDLAFTDKDGNDHFMCSTRQASVYFFNFGKDAEILSPASLREQFKERYKQAESLYAE